MEDGVSNANNKVVNMGATGNQNASRLATLQERKKIIEESLAICNKELRQLCIQEADLTGTIPTEMPLEPGESPPLIRRRVGTAFQLPENLIKNSNNKDESVTDLELQIQIRANMAEAALGLANEQNISKTLRRKHMADYQQHKSQFNALQEKLSYLKDKTHQPSLPAEQSHKQKKKPRPTEQDDNVSLNTTTNDPFIKSELRQSLRSNKCSVANDVEIDHNRLPTGYSRASFKNPNNMYIEQQYSRQDESLATGLYRLSINGYKNYMERRENMADIHISPYSSQHSTLQYNQHINAHIQYPQQVSPHFQQQSQSMSSLIQQQRSSHISIPQMYNYPTINSHYGHQEYNKLIKNHQDPLANPQLHKQSSPNLGTSNTHKYYLAHNMHSPSYRYSTVDQNYRTQNPHQIQPHQQYDQHVMAGLGGYWKRNENGEAVWCHYSPNIDSNWQRDKRFGSLDRRKNKRVHKRVSPNVDNKSATLASVPTYSDHIRSASIKSPQVINRRSQDNRQLVRTQSLGSVGAQTVDSVWPSDDNSSCESDNRSVNGNNQGTRKQKQKEWLETSLDGPVSPTHTVISRSQSAIPSILSPEDQYIASSPQHIPPPLTQKPALEIPAESNPSPRIPETNIELFNNNIPKNCTVVQAGHCKPYHEETKPFEMSDFYKYSTKFKKSPVKQPLQQDDSPKTSGQRMSPSGTSHRNLNETFDESVTSHKNLFMSAKNQIFNPSNASMSPGRLDNSNSLNLSFELNHIANANVAEHFSDEMNAWYKNQKFQIDGGGGGGSASKGKSTATLV